MHFLQGIKSLEIEGEFGAVMLFGLDEMVMLASGRGERIESGTCCRQIICAA